MTKSATAACLLLLVLAACTGPVSEKADPLARNVVDEAGLGDLMLTAGDPEEAVKYFRAALAQEPDRADYRRGLAVSLNRAGRRPEAARIYQEMVVRDQATPTDRVAYAMTALRLGRWEDAKALDADLPGGLDTARRHLLSALLADQREDWDAADAAYDRAVKQAANPAAIYNNWGVSRQARGDLDGAADLFRRALAYDSTLFSAKNNLTITRGLQGVYQLPVIPMTESEKATLLNNLGIVAVRQDKPAVAKGLFATAVEAHPQYYQAAASRLEELEKTVVR